MYKWFRDPTFLRQQYVREQKSAAQIAREIGCSRSTVIEYLHEFEIPLRENPAQRQRRGQVPYGFKMQTGRLVPHIGEQRIIAKLVELRMQGETYRQLTDWLNAKGVKTKNRAKRWDRPTVYKILKREIDDYRKHSGESNIQ